MKQNALHEFSQTLYTAIPEIQNLLVANTVGAVLLSIPYVDDDADQLAATTAALYQFGKKTTEHTGVDACEYIEALVGDSRYMVLALGSTMILGVLLPQDFSRERLLQTVREVLDTAVA